MIEIFAATQELGAQRFDVRVDEGAMPRYQ